MRTIDGSGDERAAAVSDGHPRDRTGVFLPCSHQLAGVHVPASDVLSTALQRALFIAVN